MSLPHPYLDDSFHIRWSQLTPDKVEADIEKALAEAEANLDALAGVDRGKMTFESTVLALDEATEKLEEAWGKVKHLDDVCNSDALRAAYNQMLPKVTEFFAKIPLNESLWDLFKTYSGTDEAKNLTGVRKRLYDEKVAYFQGHGADLPAEKKKRMEQVEAELAQKTQKFSENVLDATNAWEMIVDDKAKLDGLSETVLAATLSDAKAKGKATAEEPRWRLTLKAACLLPVMEQVHDEEIRRAIWEASANVANGGDHDNTALIWDILALRQEKADLLGHQDFADYALERRMAKNGAKALQFVEELRDKTANAFMREIADLEEYKSDKTKSSAGRLEPWEVSYWAERRRKELFDFDEEDLRPYFEIDKVLAGMFRIAEQIFGIELRERDSIFIEPGSGGDPGDKVEVWHPEVKFYEIYNRDGVHLGSFYADWHPRDAKRGGAWMNYLRTGTPGGPEADREPHLGLICGNMTPPSDERPALLTHREVETVFHEFGHLLHHLLGDVEFKSLNGVNVAWDFVELPSQIMENFCWERESLDHFARHYQTGEPIPAKLFKKMIAARNYMAATAMMRQLSLGKLDLELHIHHQRDRDADLDELSREILKGYRYPTKTDAPTIARRFTHLFANATGYAAGYYSYKWAEVLDADAFTRFKAEGILSEKVGGDFKDKILSKGNSEEPEKLFRDFMGRDPDLSSLLIRCGLA